MAAAPRSGRRRFAYGRLALRRCAVMRLVSASAADITAVAAAHIGAPDGVLTGVIAVRTARRIRAAIAGVIAGAGGTAAGRALAGTRFAGTGLASAGRAGAGGRIAAIAIAVAAAVLSAVTGAVVRLAANGKQVGDRPHKVRRASARCPV